MSRSIYFFAFCFTFLLVLSTVNGKKDLMLPSPLPEEVQSVINCDLCAYTLINALLGVQEIRDDLKQKELPLKEDDILSVLETLCQPYTENGEWMRRVSIHFETNGKDEKAEKTIQSTVLPYVSACKRSCSTTQVVCEQVLDSEEVDDLSATILRLAQQHEVFAVPTVWEPLITQTCHRMDMCRGATAKRNAFLQAYRKDPAVYEKLIDAEAPTKLDEDEIEVERMMDNFNRVDGKKTSVFSREEMISLQSAILRGDLKAAAKIDPSIMDLTDEEFESIQQMVAKEGHVRREEGKQDGDNLFHMTDDELDL